jgi:hypothetical protein
MDDRGRQGVLRHGGLVVLRLSQVKRHVERETMMASTVFGLTLNALVSRCFKYGHLDVAHVSFDSASGTP